MAKRTPANGDVIYEHEWLAELKRLIAKAGDNEIYVQYRFPRCFLSASGFPPLLDGRKIRILLQRQSHSDSASGVLELSLPEEEDAHYRRFEDEHGDLYLSLAYPHCNRHDLPHVEIALIEIATKAELLDSAVNDAPVQ